LTPGNRLVPKGMLFLLVVLCLAGAHPERPALAAIASDRTDTQADPAASTAGQIEQRNRERALDSVAGDGIERLAGEEETGSRENKSAATAP